MLLVDHRPGVRRAGGTVGERWAAAEWLPSAIRVQRAFLVRLRVGEPTVLRQLRLVPVLPSVLLRLEDWHVLQQRTPRHNDGC